MNRNFLVLSLGIGALLLATQSVFAQGAVCADHAEIVERLVAAYGETRQAIGLGNNNAIVEVFASDATGSWTITVTQPGGQTCLAAAGQAFQLLSENLPNTDTGA